METLEFVLVALFGAGGAGAFASIGSLIRLLRRGKIENEETLIKRLDSNNAKQSERADLAEKRADTADKEADRYRKERDSARERVARLRRVLISHGIEPPEMGQDDE